jgi:hypothetical protein
VGSHPRSIKHANGERELLEGFLAWRGALGVGWL